MTLAERRKRIREVKKTLELALLYTGIPAAQFKDLPRSNQMVGYADIQLGRLVDDLVSQS